MTAAMESSIHLKYVALVSDAMVNIHGLSVLIPLTIGGILMVSSCMESSDKNCRLAEGKG
jgi:hypothetical protein